MIIPIRCFSCGKVIADLWDAFQNKVAEGQDQGVVMDELGLERYCCRRMFISHIDLIHEVAPFSTSLE
jgi:DNA-directed RNA polymerase subunit N